MSKVMMFKFTKEEIVARMGFWNAHKFGRWIPMVHPTAEQLADVLTSESMLERAPAAESWTEREGLSIYSASWCAPANNLEWWSELHEAAVAACRLQIGPYI